MDAPTVLKGSLSSDRATKAVVILRDENTPEATVSTPLSVDAGSTHACLCSMDKRDVTQEMDYLAEWAA